MGSFRSWKGIGQLPVDLEVARDHPTAIAVSIQAGAGDGGEGAKQTPSQGPFLWGSLEAGP